jgi:hypothetical protein
MELLKNHTDALPQPPQSFTIRTSGKAKVAHNDFSTVKSFQPVDASQEGALPTTGGSDQRYDLARLHVHRNPIQDDHIAMTLDEVDNSNHIFSPPFHT